MAQKAQKRVLTYKRDLIISKLDNFEKYIQDVEQSKPEGGAQAVAARVEAFGAFLNDFESIQTELELLDAQPVTDRGLRDTMTDKYFDLMARSRALISRPVTVKSDIKQNIPVNTVKLPTISLPKFSGKVTEWLGFKDTFEALIHNNSTIENIEKLHYLRSALEGAAFSVVGSVGLSSENYVIAWDLICNRFNNKNILVHNHLNELFKLDKIKSITAGSLRALMEGAEKNLAILRNFGLPVDHWDTLIIHLLSDKLDDETRNKWDELKANSEFPTLDEFKKFIYKRASALEVVETNKQENVKPMKSRALVTTIQKCPVCAKNHKIHTCESFISLSPKLRYNKAKELLLCINCLRANHTSKDCRSQGCHKCRQRHNTLLHFNKSNNQHSEFRRGENAVRSTSPTPSHEDIQWSLSTRQSNAQEFNENMVLLQTALIYVIDANGYRHTCRVLLDNGSQLNLITNSFFKRLGLPSYSTNIALTGITGGPNQITKAVNLEISSMTGSYAKGIKCLVTPSINGNIPLTHLSVEDIDIPKNVTLADPAFHKPKAIDMLLGANAFWNVLESDRITINKNIHLQASKLGYFVCGTLPINTKQNKSLCNVVFNLQRFWELEEVPRADTEKTADPSEIHFQQTFTTQESGRFVVSIPFTDSPEVVGETYSMAKNRLENLEHKLEKNPQTKVSYHAFLQEYIDLGHMQLINNNDFKIFLPHHCVEKEQSTTTKLRVVFDASAKGSFGKSLNDIQLVGPRIQQDLLSILIRFRLYKIVVTADIEKMYRQILIPLSQRNTQCILFRFSPEKPIQTYQLNTITYGTASASFLSTRCLTQLAIDNKQLYPTAAEIVGRDFYVDDLLTGFDNLDEAITVISQINKILTSAQMNLRKWSSNEQTLTNLLSNNETTQDIVLGDQQQTKTLGLYWDNLNDQLMFKIDISINDVITKRLILSIISQTFDPLGLMAPCVIRMKILIQLLWLRKLSWDDPVPSELAEPFKLFCKEFQTLNKLKISRRALIGVSNNFELHGFADASERAYGAAVYVRTINNDTVTVHLLCAKTRVAPLKVVSIAKLELCAAQLLTNLIQSVKGSLVTQPKSITLWTDSTITLQWLRTPPRLLKTFVANRVSQIQTDTCDMIWQHVSSRDNPADLASRGISPLELINNNFWWCGPEFLSRHESTWKTSSIEPITSLPEQRAEFSFIVTSLNLPLFTITNNLNKLTRIVAYMLRFVHNCRNKDSKLTSSLSIAELDNALLHLVKQVQNESFSKELSVLINGKDVLDKSPLACLSPFLDEHGIIRVGGRLANANLEYGRRHPILLPKGHKLVEMIFLQEHKDSCHAGPQHLLYKVRERYWPLRGRDTARKIVHNCVRCCRARPSAILTKMGNLPVQRVNPNFPFAITGLDFAGPILLKDREGRNFKTFKAYICLFVCFVTRSVHLELVPSLSTQSFLAALRRFVARRGAPSEVHCDNGLNFVGAANELAEMHEFVTNNSTYLTDALRDMRIVFKFIPPYSPHMGGLWEAGVKSAKHHLKRVIGLSKFTFEQYDTVLCQIESLLNSRPLSPMSSDPNDLLPLTPSHFLLGRPSGTVCDPPLDHLNINRLSIYQHLQRLKQDFWSRWSIEYINTLQMRQRRFIHASDIKLGQMVLVRENTPPLVWPLGRIVETHPGRDGVVRVVSIKTEKGIVKRALTKVCPLPVAIE